MGAVWGRRCKAGGAVSDSDGRSSVGGGVDFVAGGGGAIERDCGPDRAIVSSSSDAGEGEAPFVS